MPKKFLPIISLVLISAFAANAAEPTFKETYDSVVKNYEQKKYADSLKDVDKALSLAGTDAEKLLVLSYKFKNYNIQCNYIEAANAAGDILKLQELTGPQRDQWLLLQIIGYCNGKKFDECIAACDQLIDSKEAEYIEQGYHYKTAAYLLMKDNDKAFEVASKYRAEYTSGVKIPMYYRSVIYQMTALKNKKEYDKAVAVITPEEAEEIPGALKSEYYNLLGSTYKDLKKYQEAAAAFEKAGQGNHAYQGGLGWYYLGDVYSIMNKDNEAIAAFTKVYELNDASSTHKTMAIVRCAKLLDKNGKPEDALVMLEKVNLIVAPDAEWAARGKILAGNILLHHDKKDDAKKQFEAIVGMRGVSASYINQAKAELEKLK